MNYRKIFLLTVPILLSWQFVREYKGGFTRWDTDVTGVVKPCLITVV